MVHRCLSCAWSVFGSVILNLLCVCVCVRYDGLVPSPSYRTHTHHCFKITLPNTDQAHDKRQWTTTSNFSQVQLYNPWWWVAYDEKHVGVIFNFVSFKLLYNVDLTSKFYIKLGAFSRLIKVIDCNNARWKLEISCLKCMLDLRIPPRSRWDLHSYVILRNV